MNGPRAAGPFLALDTATRTAAVAIGAGETVLAARTWSSGHHASDSLLASIDEVLREAGTSIRALEGVIAGIGPGSFTGLRVGLATAKVIAYALGVPIAGIPTARALALAAEVGPVPEDPSGGSVPRAAVVIPAGPSDRYLTLLSGAVARAGLAAEVDPRGSSERAATRVLTPAALADELTAAIPAGTPIIAVDLPTHDPAASADARRLGERAVAGLGPALLALGSAALRAGRSEAVEELVPAYALLPRGITEVTGSIRWSSDHR